VDVLTSAQPSPPHTAAIEDMSKGPLDEFAAPGASANVRCKWPLFLNCNRPNTICNDRLTATPAGRLAQIPLKKWLLDCGQRRAVIL
jgi:hypothetical protein